MPDGPYPTPDEERLMRMLHESGTPEAAGATLIARLEALEAAVAALEAAAQVEPQPDAAEEADPE
jgi:hypothetical protein